MTTKPKLSILICAHNEEKNLRQCLEHLKFGDELIVVLDKCTDRSKEIALEYGAIIHEGSYEFEGDRRNQAISMAQGEWCLEVDCDEIIPDALHQEIIRVIATSQKDYHLIKIDNYIAHRLIRYGWGAYFGTGSTVRLFKKGSKLWGRQRVHPEIQFTGHEGVMLTVPLIHHVDKDLTDTIKRLNSYSTAHALDLAEDPQFIDSNKETLWRNVRRIFSRFYKCYVLRKGYKEGHVGFLIALCAGLYPILSFIKAKHLTEQRSL